MSGKGLLELEGSARLIDILYHKIGGHKGYIYPADFVEAMKQINSIDPPIDAWEHLGLEGYEEAHCKTRKKRNFKKEHARRKIMKDEFVAMAEKYRIYMNGRDRHIQNARRAVVDLKPYCSELAPAPALISGNRSRPGERVLSRLVA